MKLKNCVGAIANSPPLFKKYGKIQSVVGMTVEATLAECNIGDLCKIYSADMSNSSKCEVVGYKNGRATLMPFSDEADIGPGNVVQNTGERLRVPVGEELLGRVINAVGEPIDNDMPINAKETYPVGGTPTNPLTRPRIDTRMELGVKAIDGTLTLGKGQRIGIFAGSGVGKSTLLGMIARNVKADLSVIALVGERGREVVEFIQRDLGPEGMARSVLVVATSDQTAMMRSKCAQTATSIAEYFRDQGKDVLLMMDSLTRFAMAQREVGLNIGEPPIARGYTPSIYSMLPKLLERSGNFEKGSITGIYTVLVEGDDTNEPISDTVRGIIDGHIILSRKIAAKNHYPAIDVSESVSRLMIEIVDKKQYELAAKLRNILAVYNSNIDLISIGAYKKGANPLLDKAMSKIEKVNAFLTQDIYENFDYAKMLTELEECVR